MTAESIAIYLSGGVNQKLLFCALVLVPVFSLIVAVFFDLRVRKRADTTSDTYYLMRGVVWSQFGHAADKAYWSASAFFGAMNDVAGVTTIFEYANLMVIPTVFMMVVGQTLYFRAGLVAVMGGSWMLVPITIAFSTVSLAFWSVSG